MLVTLGTWMKGDVTPTPPSPFLPPPASLGSSLGSETPEHERVAAAYALGRHASVGDPSAVGMLQSALSGDDDDASRKLARKES